MIVLTEGRFRDNVSEIVNYHREDDGKLRVEVVKNFRHYFYCDEEAPVEALEGVLRTEKGFTSIDNTSVKKVVMHTHISAKKLREKIVMMGFKVWEADIPYHNRYCMDNPPIEEGPIKVCWFDIETAPENVFTAPDEDLAIMAFPNVDIADQAVCSISAKIGDTITAWLCGPKEIEGVRYFEKETDMLEDFLQYLHKEKPDVLSAWNLDGFDMPYLVNRCERLGINYQYLSRAGRVYQRHVLGRKVIRGYGTIYLDALEAYKLWRKYGNLPLLESHSLDFVGQTVVGETKIHHGKTIGWLWKHDPQTLIDYNKQDVELMDKIDKACLIIGFFDSLRRKCHVQFEDVYKTTAMIDGFLLSRLNHKIILPTAEKVTGDKYPGAYVFKTMPGLHENVLCEDIASMYPSIIDNYNISYETVKGDDYKLPLDSGISFSNKTGIIPSFLGELKKERKEYKRLRKNAKTDYEYKLYDQRQFATKIVMNSFYGYLGFPGARLYKREVAEAITGMGQYIIHKIADWCNTNGNQVIYGDTDSVYCLATETEPFKVVMEGVKLMKLINDNLEKMNKEIAGHNSIFMEFEKALEKVLFTDAKKRYAYVLLWELDSKFDVDKKIHVQGFDQKRSDTSKVSKIAQSTLVEMIMQGKSKNDVLAYLRKMNKDMKAGKFSDADVGFPKGITKDLNDYKPLTPVVKGALFSNKEFGTVFKKGTKPKFIYIKTYKGKEQYMTADVKGEQKTFKVESISYDEEIPPGFIIDWTLMADKTFRAKLEKIFEAVDWAWEDLDVMGLEQFM